MGNHVTFRFLTHLSSEGRLFDQIAGLSAAGVPLERCSEHWIDRWGHFESRCPLEHFHQGFQNYVGNELSALQQDGGWQTVGEVGWATGWCILAVGKISKSRSSQELRNFSPTRWTELDSKGTVSPTKL